MTIDLDRARAETPGVANVLHLNNAGAALPPTPVVARMIGYLEREAAIGGYEAEAEAEPEIDGGLRLDRAADRRARRTRSPSARTPRAPGTWRSTASRSGRATGS